MKQKKVRLDLVGLDGNAYSLLAAFRRAAKQQGWTDWEIEGVILEAQKGDYDHLLQTLLAVTESEEEWRMGR